MSFIRLKRRTLKDQDAEYAYLVSNKWCKEKGSPRQAVSKYLGRVFEGKPQKDISFAGFIAAPDISSYIGTTSKNKIIIDLIRWELFRHAFDAKIDYINNKKTVCSKGKDVVLKINQGFMCGYTIRRIFNFVPRNDDEREIGIMLAQRFVEAGIQVPHEIFIGFFDKTVTITY